MNIEAGNAATDSGSMQAAADKLEGLLFPEAEADDAEALEPAQEAELEDVSDDAEELPDEDESEDEDEEGSDLDDIAEGEELSLAGYLGIDEERIVEDEDGNIVFNSIVNGETTQVPLKDLVKDHQLASHTNNKSIALENERKEFEEQRQQAVSEMKVRVEGVFNLSKALEGQLVAEYDSINWDRLRAENPAEWTALRQEYADKATQLQSAQQLIAEEGKRMQDDHNNKMQEQAGINAQEQYKQTIAKRPEWAEPAVFKAANDEMSAFLTESYGFPGDVLSSLDDHRMFDIIQDAMAYRNGKKIASKKREKPVPKFKKPGRNRGNTKSLAKARKVKASKAALKANGSTQNVANAILDRM